MNGHKENRTAVLDEELIKETSSTAVAPVPEQNGHLQPEPEVLPQKKKQSRVIFAAAAVGVIVLGALGYHYWQYSSTHQETDDAEVEGHIHEVSSRIPGTVSQVLVNDNQLVKPGQLLVKLDPRDYQSQVQQAAASLENADHQAKAADANIALSVQTDTGKKTQAQGDVSTAIANISTAQAAVAEAQAGIPAAQDQVKVATAGVGAAKAQVAQANANLENALVQYRRYNKLYQQGAVPRQQLDAVKATYDITVAQKKAALEGVQQAQATLASAKVGVAKAQSQLAQAQEEVASAQAKLAASEGALQQANITRQDTSVKRSQYGAAKAAIDQAQAALKNAQLQLSYTDITAPSAGWVGNKNVEVGNRIAVGAPLLAIVDQDKWVVANFKETQLDKMVPGQEVEIKLDTFPNHTFIGHVNSISPASGAQFALLPPDNATGNFTKIVQRIPVKIIFDPKSIQGYESRVVPGMSAEISVKVK